MDMAGDEKEEMSVFNAAEFASCNRRIYGFKCATNEMNEKLQYVLFYLTVNENIQ